MPRERVKMGEEQAEVRISSIRKLQTAIKQSTEIPDVNHISTYVIEISIPCGTILLN
jgi:hypothetical protein